MKDGTRLLVKVSDDYCRVTADFGGYTTNTGRYISPHDIDEYAVLTND